MGPGARAGATPRATVLGPEGKLFVQGWLSRNVMVYDMSALLTAFDKGTLASGR